MYVDKDIFSLCTYLDKIYEDENVGSSIFSSYLKKESSFDVVKKFTLSEISISGMETLPAFLSYVWVLKRIYDQLNRLFNNRDLYKTEILYSEIDASDNGITEILSRFSKGVKRNEFKEYAKYNEFLAMSVELENAIDIAEASKKPIFLTDAATISVDEFLKGEFTVLSPDTKSLKSYLVVKQNKATVKGLFKKIIATNKSILFARE